MEGIEFGEGASGARGDRMPERQHFPEYAQANLLGEAYPIFLTSHQLGGTYNLHRENSGKVAPAFPHISSGILP